MPDEIRPTEPATTGFVMNLGLKSIFDWGWKAIIILWAAFQFYSQQDRLAEREKQNEARIAKVETDFNELQRQKTDRDAILIRLQQQFEDNGEFYKLTHQSK